MNKNELPESVSKSACECIDCGHIGTKGTWVNHFDIYLPDEDRIVEETVEGGIVEIDQRDGMFETTDVLDKMRRDINRCYGQNCEIQDSYGEPYCPECGSKKYFALGASRFKNRDVEIGEDYISFIDERREEIVRWTVDEWQQEDLTLTIANAIKIFYEYGPDYLKRMIR